MADIIPFEFNGHPFTVITFDNGDPWFVAIEVCTHLGLSHVTRSCERLDTDEKDICTFSTDVSKVPQTRVIVSESGFYKLVMRSNKPIAKTFQRWVTHEVLPSLRRTGRYDIRLPQGDDAVDRFPELRAIRDLIQSTAEARVVAEKAQQEARSATENANRALNAQQFFTVAEYVYFERLTDKVPPTQFGALSHHLQHYCLEKGIPFRRQTVGGKKWDAEYSFHISVYVACIEPWIVRHFNQPQLYDVKAQDLGSQAGTPHTEEN